MDRPGGAGFGTFSALVADFHVIPARFGKLSRHPQHGFGRIDDFHVLQRTYQFTGPAPGTGFVIE
jgi:hypothetical protein